MQEDDALHRIMCLRRLQVWRRGPEAYPFDNYLRWPRRFSDLVYAQ